MTRINVVDPSELHNKHLMGEIHEILRVHGLVRKAQDRKINKYNFQQKVNPPKEYTLGAGHVKFFYDKLGYVTERYHALCDEARNRGYNVTKISREDVLQGIDDFWVGSYTPTPEAIELNRARLQERLSSMNHLQNKSIDSV